MIDKTNLGGVEFSNISDSTIQTGDITTNITAGGDVIGRDKIINNITQIKERALTAAEAADKAQAIARQRLAEAVTAYVERMGQIAADDQDALQGGPYRGLKAYTLHQAEIFFGRDEAMAALLSHLQRGRLTILHAESGAGKSSLLQAGIQYQLIVQGHVPLYVRPYDKSPALAIKQALLPGLDSLPELASASLRDYLHQVAAVLGTQTILVILIDQFEELFFNLNEEERQAFVEELAACLEDESLTVRWVLALRTEFFGNLANFRPRIKNPFENDFRLNRLNLVEAKTVITEPAARQGISFEPELVGTLLTDLHEEDSDKISPPQIQLVCSALYNALLERRAENPDLPPTITLQMYQEEGQAQGILRGHLSRVLRRTLSPEEREAARQLLIAMVSSDQRRIRRTKSDLVDILAAYLTSAISLDDLLDQLVESRLLNVDRDDETGEGIYELAHDYLLAEIEIDPETQAKKVAREILDQEIILGQQNLLEAHVIPKNRLEIIERYLTIEALPEAEVNLVSRSRDYHAQLEKNELERVKRELSTQRNLVWRTRALLAVVSIVALVLAIEPIMDQVGRIRAIRSAPLVQIDELGVGMEPFEVSNQRYRWCIDAEVCSSPNGFRQKLDNWDYYKKKPVVNVDATDAMDFCNWIGRTLPTAKQWIHVAPPANKWKYLTSNEALFCNSEEGCRNPDYLEDIELRTTPQFVPPNKGNEQGVYDLAGSVSEWTRTITDPQDDTLCLDTDAKKLGEQITNVVTLGDSFDDPPAYIGDYDNARQSIRGNTFRSVDIGFRCVSENVAPNQSFTCPSMNE